MRDALSLQLTFFSAWCKTFVKSGLCFVSPVVGLAINERNCEWRIRAEKPSRLMPPVLKDSSGTDSISNRAP